MLQNANYFWRAYLERPIWETILRTRGLSGVHQGSVWQPFQMSSKFGELIGTALQIETLKLISWSLSWVPQSIGNPSGLYQGVIIVSQVSVRHFIWGSIRGSIWVFIRGLLGGPLGAFGVSFSPNDLFKWAPNLESSLVRLSELRT